MQPNAEADRSFRATYVSLGTNNPRLSEVLTATSLEEAIAKAKKRTDEMNKAPEHRNIFNFHYKVVEVYEIGRARS